MKILVSIAAILLICSMSATGLAETGLQEPSKPIRELLIQLNKEYLILENELKRLEGSIRNFPDTTLSISVVKRDSSIRLVAVEIFYNNRPIGSHMYTPLENKALDAGGRHQLFEGELKEGSHNLKIAYYWTKDDKPPQKDEITIPVSIWLGKNSFLELTFGKKENKAWLTYSQYDFSTK